MGFPFGAAGGIGSLCGGGLFRLGAGGVCLWRGWGGVVCMSHTLRASSASPSKVYPAIQLQ